MKQNRIHTAPKSLICTGDYRWIVKLSIRKGTLCDYFDHFLKW